MPARAPYRDINGKNKTTKISFVVIARGYRTASEAAVSGYFFFVVFLAFFAGAFLGLSPFISYLLYVCMN